MANIKLIGAWSRYVNHSDSANVSMKIIWKCAQGAIAALCFIVTCTLLAKRDSSEGTVTACITDTLSEILYMFPALDSPCSCLELVAYLASNS